MLGGLFRMLQVWRENVFYTEDFYAHLRCFSCIRLGSRELLKAEVSNPFLLRGGKSGSLSQSYIKGWNYFSISDYFSDVNNATYTHCVNNRNRVNIHPTFGRLNSVEFIYVEPICILNSLAESIPDQTFSISDQQLILSDVESTY